MMVEKIKNKTSYMVSLLETVGTPSTDVDICVLYIYSLYKNNLGSSMNDEYFIILYNYLFKILKLNNFDSSPFLELYKIDYDVNSMFEIFKYITYCFYFKTKSKKSLKSISLEKYLKDENFTSFIDIKRTITATINSAKIIN